MYNRYTEELTCGGCGTPMPKLPPKKSRGCGGECLPSKDNETNVLLRQLREEIKKLSQTTTARLLCQDKKIAETMVYIKNNLSNSLRDLLTSMEESGELDTLILDAISNVDDKISDLGDYFNTKSLSLDFTRIFRHMAASKGNRVAGSDRNNTTAFAQSITQTPETIIFAEVCNFNYNNNAHFVEFNKTTNAITREFDLRDVGHVSATAYNHCKKELYVLPFYYNVNGSTERTLDLKVYDYTSLALKKVIQLSVNVAAITYDNENQVMYAATNDTVYRVNTDGTMIALFTYEASGTIQGISVYGGCIYIAFFNSTYLLKLDLEGNVICRIPIARYYGLNFTGEPEGITIDCHGNMYMLSCAYTPYAYYYCNQVFKTNIAENTAIGESRSGNVLSLAAFTIGNPTSNNPDGSAGNPFGTVCEALLALGSPAARNMGCNRINLAKDCAEETIYYRDADFVIMGSNYKVAQITLQDCNVYLNGIKVENPSDLAQSHNTLLSRCSGVIFSITSTQNHGDYCLNLEYSQIRIVGATCNGTPTKGRIYAIGGEVYANTQGVLAMIFGNSQSSQKITGAFSSVTPLNLSKEQIHQLSNVFTNLELFCSLSQDGQNYYSGTDIKLTSADMAAIASGTLNKKISCEFVTAAGAYLIGCSLRCSNGAFTLSDFTSHLLTAGGDTVGTKQFIVESIIAS